MRAFLVPGAAAALLAAGCAAGHTPPAPAQHASPPPPRTASPSESFRLTGPQACARLLADVTRNQGSPDIPTLRLIADHAAAPRLAADARTAVRDMAHTGMAPVAFALLRDDCARAGVQVPAP